MLNMIFESHKMWTKSKNCFRKINKIEKDIGGFDASYFAEEAVDLYIMAHEALVNDDRARLHELVTSKCFTELRHGLQYKTLRWGYTRRLACALPCFIILGIWMAYAIKLNS